VAVVVWRCLPTCVCAPLLHLIRLLNLRISCAFFVDPVQALVDLEILDPMPSFRKCVRWALDRFYELYHVNIRALLRVSTSFYASIRDAHGHARAPDPLCSSASIS
jgi:hypothetical protein